MAVVVHASREYRTEAAQNTKQPASRSTDDPLSRIMNEISVCVCVLRMLSVFVFVRGRREEAYDDGGRGGWGLACVLCMRL